MSSNRPYLIRAMHEWITDNGLTPYLLVDASHAGLRVPPGVAQDGKVVLNIAPRAVSRLEMGNDSISFLARFGGVSQSVSVPVQAVQAIYARETGEGMMMPPEPAAESAAPLPSGGDAARVEPALAPRPFGSLADDNGENDRPDPPRRGSHLRVVK